MVSRYAGRTHPTSDFAVNRFTPAAIDSVAHTSRLQESSVPKMIERINETIVARSSAPGRSPLGIVRMTGPASFDVLQRMARADTDAPFSSFPTGTRVGGLILLGHEIDLPAAFYLFRAPRSYTRQDTVEIHTIGSPVLLELVREKALTLGAIAAEPGEFTARAFLNGAMNIAEAEAVAATINAQTDTQLRASHRMMDGSLARRINEIRSQLAELLALVEADIDFSEEPIDFISPDALVVRLTAIRESLKPMLSPNASTERIDVLPRILMLGPPNAGKSSLMNRLSETSRSICAAAAGTTRDVLSAPIRLGPFEAILLDAAGIDQQAGFTSSQERVIAAGQRNVLAVAEQVDLALIVVDLTRETEDSFWETLEGLHLPCRVVALNKIDLLEDDEPTRVPQKIAGMNPKAVCFTSAFTGAGMDSLRSALADALGIVPGTILDESIILNQRQQSAVAQAAAALDRGAELARTADATIDCADLLAFELREGLDALGVVAGAVTTEDLLTQVFANFCIGK